MAGSRTYRCAPSARSPSHHTSNMTPRRDWFGRSAKRSATLAAGKLRRFACQPERRFTTTGFSRSSGSFRWTRWRSAISLRPRIPWSWRTCPRGSDAEPAGMPLEGEGAAESLQDRAGAHIVIRLLARSWPVLSLGWQGAGEGRCRVDPLLQRSAGQATGFDEDHAFHGASGEVHRPHVRLVQGAFSAIRTEPHHKGVLDDAAEHVTGEHKGHAAEHL